MNITYQKLKLIYEAKGYAFFDNGSYNLNLFGIRSSSPLVDEFNDVMGIAYRDEFNNEQLLIFKATTKPGLYFLKKKLGNARGTAILIPGQYRSCWRLGTHKGYAALQQSKAGVFKVWRDNDSDGDLDMHGPVYNDVTGLNGHTTSFKNDIEKVGAYSAGCQVIQDDLDFKLFLSIIRKSTSIYSDIFSYTLFEETDIN